jgi:hypothetical protein
LAKKLQSASCLAGIKPGLCVCCVWAIEQFGRFGKHFVAIKQLFKKHCCGWLLVVGGVGGVGGVDGLTNVAKHV